jgi:hypothetical protein
MMTGMARAHKAHKNEGYTKVILCKNTKFDAVLTKSNSSKRINQLIGFLLPNLKLNFVFLPVDPLLL